jgi:hypothetical protein
MAATSVQVGTQAQGRFPTPAPAGNQRAVRHGLGSETAIAPLRATYVAELKDSYPNVPHPVLLVQAARMARLELASRYIDKHGVLRNVRGGVPYPIVQQMQRDERALERWYADRALEEESKSSSSAELYAQVLERLAAEEAPADAQVVDDA